MKQVAATRMEFSGTKMKKAGFEERKREFFRCFRGRKKTSSFFLGHI